MAEKNSSPRTPVTSLQRKIFQSFANENIEKKIIVNSYATLPLYRTPPSTFKCQKPYNPFNQALRERLGGPIFSPTVFENVLSPREVSSREFRWTIDEVSRCKPASIEESFSHTDVEDHEEEKTAQEAIEKYFANAEFLSPLEAPIYCSSPLSDTPVTRETKCNKTFDKHKKITINVSTQTNWRLLSPPKEVEDILEPHVIDIKSLENCSLRMSIDNLSTGIQINMECSTENINMYTGVCENIKQLGRKECCDSPVNKTPVSREVKKRLKVRIVDKDIQTDLILPEVLPIDTETMLKPYLSVISGDFIEDDENLNTSVLRRRLNFNLSDDFLNQMICDSTNHCKDSMDPVSPPLMQAATPLAACALSPLDISPIVDGSVNRSKVAIKLDFSNSISMTCDDKDNSGLLQGIEQEFNEDNQDTGYQTESYEKVKVCCSRLIMDVDMSSNMTSQ